MTIMFLILLLQLMNSFEGSSGVNHETLCTLSACYTFHVDQLNFEEAQQKCVNNGGSLITVRRKEDEEEVRPLLSKIHRHSQDSTVTFWIGLKLPASNCVSPHKALRGFKWVSGEETSDYSNWGKEPDLTCTTNRCVTVKYSLSGQNHLKWTAGSCKTNSYYACKFNFQRMCKPLVLSGPGRINYTLPFSEESERSKLTYVPIGTFAIILCHDKQEHYSVCGTWEWSPSGPFCKVERQDCKTNNGGCQHDCQEDGDQVRCLCKEGYELEEDGFSCRYACRDGYEMEDGKCSDVNECAQSRCQHGCSNSDGSFSCYCGEGFALSEDGYSCVDVDECANNRCQFGCVNTVGDFRCTCPHGFYLEPDELNCAPYLTDAPTASAGDPPQEETFTESSIRRHVELQPQSPRTDAPSPGPVVVTHGGEQSSTSLTTTIASAISSKVIICVLGSVIPLLVLITVTIVIAVFRCSRSKKEAKKNTSTDGYCWVSSGLDPRLEKFYESIETDDP